MNTVQAHTGVTIAFTNIDTALLKLLDISSAELDASYSQGERYLNVYRLRFNNVIHWVTYTEDTGAAPLVTTTEEVKQFIFETELFL